MRYGSFGRRPLARLLIRQRAYLDRASQVSGRLSFEGPACIDGRVDGELIARDCLMIGEHGVGTARISAASVIVAGKISGEITASQRVEILPTAKVLGNLNSPVRVHEGAVFDGDCVMRLAGTPEDRKVTVSTSA